MTLFSNSRWQHFIPKHALSRLVGMLAETDVEPIKNFLIDTFIKHYQVDLTDALIQDPHQFESFNDFFTRTLKPEARPIDQTTNSIISPADGSLSEWGLIQDQQLFQAKGQTYSLSKLLANQLEWADAFAGGHYATVYLAPKDYHRVHMPFAGTLMQMTHIPGELFSVNQKTSHDIPEVFARNERVICIFETAYGPMAVILIGALIVASISVSWHGQVTPITRRVQHWQYQPETIHLEKGAELGRFSLGSTVVILLPKDAVEFKGELVLGQSLKMGEGIGLLR